MTEFEGHLDEHSVAQYINVCESYNTNSRSVYVKFSVYVLCFVLTKAL